MAGRSTKLTPKVQERIVSAIRAGNYVKVAADAAGVGESTFYAWLQRGALEPEGPYREFLEDVKAAEAEAETTAVAAVRSAMTDSWQAAMTFLERRHPDRWKRRDELDLRKLSTDQLLALAAACDERVESAGDRMATAAGERQAAD